MGVGEMVAEAGFFFALGDAVVSDVRAFRIPNRDSLVLIASFGLSALASGMDGGTVLWHLGACLMVFLVGAAMFALNIWGGGDAKLLAAVALWTGLAGLPRLLMVMALAGGGLAAAVLALRRLPFAHPHWAKVWRQGVIDSGHVPYGVAIAAASFVWWWDLLRPGWLP